MTIAQSFSLPEGLHYDATFVSGEDYRELIDYLCLLRPIWERRYSSDKTTRSLLRPVYWLGNWQFACLNYYRPPLRVRNCCVRAEPFPPILQKIVGRMEVIARRKFPVRDIPKGWHFNTCLINYYGSRSIDNRWEDVARVGEHKDFEPGPVGSLSFGERAFFQFVSSSRKGAAAKVAFQQWLGDGSLQLFAGKRWKEELFHRVQRVERGTMAEFPVRVEEFRVRRINLTLRYVVDEHIQPYAKLPSELAGHVREYMEVLSKQSRFFRKELSAHVG